MDKKIAQLINDGKYQDACEAADEYFDSFALDEAEEIYNEIYERIIDETGRDSETAISLLRKLAWTSFRKSNYDIALSLFNSVLEWYVQNGLDNTEDALDTMMDIVEVYWHYNRFEEMYSICSRAYDIAVEEFGEAALISRSILRRFADCCTSLGRYKEAELCFRQLLEIYEKAEEIDIKEKALTYDGLGFVYENMGLRSKAKETYENGIEIIEKTDDTETLLGIQNDLCGLYAQLSMADEALSLRKSILERAEGFYGFDHYNVHICKSNLADAYEDCGELKKAAELFEICYNWAKNNLGERHRETIRNEERILRLLWRMGNGKDALKMAEHVYMYKCEVLGEEHINTMFAIYDLAYCYIELNKFGIAKELMTKLVNYLKDNYGENHDYYAVSMDLIYICARLGKYSEVLEDIDRLEKLGQSFEEPAAVNGFDLYKSMAYRGLKEFDKAEEFQKRYIEHNVNKYGEKYPETLLARYGLACIYFDKGDYHKALSICEMLANMFETHCQVYKDKLNNDILLARIKSVLSEFEKSSEMIEKLLKTIDKDDYPAVFADVCYAAAENFKNMKRFDKAKEYAEKAVVLCRSIYDAECIEIKKFEELSENIGKECV